MSPGIHSILSLAATHGKVGFPRSCHAHPVGVLPIITELVRDGYIVWDGIATITMSYDVIVSCDIYQLTRAGVLLCKSLGITVNEDQQPSLKGAHVDGSL